MAGALIDNGGAVVDPALVQQQQNTWLEYRVRTECQGTKIYRKHSNAGRDRVNCSLRREGDSHGVSGLDQDRPSGHNLPGGRAGRSRIIPTLVVRDRRAKRRANTEAGVD